MQTANIRLKALSALEAFRGETPFNLDAIPTEPEELQKWLQTIGLISESVSVTLRALAFRLQKGKTDTQSKRSTMKRVKSGAHTKEQKAIRGRLRGANRKEKGIR